MSSSTGRVDVSQLRRRLDGRVMLPGDDGYDSARTVWNAMVDRRPAVAVRCTSSADVAVAVDFARRSGLEIGVRCGGHSILGICVPDDGLLIDLSGLRAVRVDPDARRAWVQGGALLGDLDRAAQEVGLATTAGNVSHTGVGGLTLGGGMGWLARRFGLACDNVVSYEIVTADGDTLQVNEGQHEDLFWGLRGGGGKLRGRHRVRVPSARDRNCCTAHRLRVRPGRRTLRHAPLARPVGRGHPPAGDTDRVGRHDGRLARRPASVTEPDGGEPGLRLGGRSG